MNISFNASDQELLQATARADKTAFSILLNRHLSAIIDFASKYVHRHDDAEDIAQETFFRVWQKAPMWKPQNGSTPCSWLYRITYNLCMDSLRKRQPNVPLDDITLIANIHSNPEQRALLWAQMSQLEIALSRLNVRQHTAITLCVDHGLSNKEAASAMGLSVDALESLLARARRALRKYMKSSVQGKAL